MEEMKYYIFYREDNNFDDILTDPIIKKLFDFKIKWSQYLMLGSNKVSSETYSYMLLKYGDDLKRKSDIFMDRSPISGKDYIPDPKRPEKFKNQ